MKTLVFILIPIVCILTGCAATYETKAGNKISFQVTDAKAVRELVNR